MSKRFMAVFLTVFVAALTAACSKPPTADIDAARAALEAATTAEAEMYAPDAYQAAQEAELQLNTELTAQEEKFALLRSYTRATELAATARTTAEQAQTAATEEKERVRVETTQLIADAKLALEEASTLLAQAPRGKGSQADIDMMKADLTTVEQSLGEADGALAASNFMDARNKAQAALKTATDVKMAVTQAQEMRAGR